MASTRFRFALATAILIAPTLFGAEGGCGGKVTIGAHDGGTPSDDAGPSDGGKGACPPGYIDDGAGNCCTPKGEEPGTCVGSVDGGTVTCAPDSCGPTTADIRICDDGSAADRRCLPNKEGKCSWQDICPPPKKECVVSGCSGEICADEPVASPCIWKEEFACYKKHGVCERDAAGKCGWRKTKELEACLGTSSSSCGGISGAACKDGYYCHYESSQKCGAGDATGTCKPKPEACTLEWNPVCGCDGKTYGNACAASYAGVSIASTGECPKS